MKESHRFALSAAQRGIWLGQSIDPDSPAYWAGEYLELQGELQRDLWQTAALEVLGTTEALHQSYGLLGGELWQCARPERELALAIHDFSRDANPGASAQRWMHADLQRSVDLAQGALFSTALLSLAPDHHYWYFSAHHIALDGYAFNLMEKRVLRRYAEHLSGSAVALQAPPSELRAIVAEDERYRASAAFASDAAFWRARLSDVADPVSPGPHRPLARAVLRRRVPLTSESLLRLKATARACGSSWSSWLLAIVAGWLERETGIAEHTLGMPLTGRFGSVGATLPCMMMNIVPVRICIDSRQSLRELAQRTERELGEMRPHQRYRYEDMKRDLGASGGGRRLFGPVVNLMPFEAPLRMAKLSVTTHPLSAGPVEDLVFGFASDGQQWRLDLEANPNAYEAATLERVERTLHRALESDLDFASCSLPALFDHDDAPSSTSISHGEPLAESAADVLQVLREHGRRAPKQAALEQQGHASLDYAELLRRVQCLAFVLTVRGIGPEQRVALLLERSPNAVIAQLAVLWAGAAYVPIDPDGPSARIQLVLEEACPTLVITEAAQRELAAGYPQLQLDDERWLGPEQPEPSAVRASALAYVIFTSGSSGKPNGVMIERGALAHFVAAARQRYAMNSSDRVLQFAPLQFDASVEEIFVSLCSGATLVLRTSAMLESLSEFLMGCARLSLTVLDLPTAFWHELSLHLSRSGALPESVRLTIIGGEAALPDRVARFRAAVGSSVVLLNTYGPTEATVVFTTASLRAADPLQSVPIGHALAGLSTAVVDDTLRLVPRGKEGELCLIGPTLARGYCGRNNLSARRFVTLEHLPGKPRGYLTSDRVHMDESGMLTYVGRKDDELKISGHRVSPLEVETALLTIPGIEAAAVFSDSSVPGRPRLIACCVGDASAPKPAALRARLAQRLAAPAIPSLFLPIASLPRDANGKVDRKALKALVPAASEPAPISAGWSARERIISSVWADVLGTPVPSLDADFFALGGHSLLALQAAEQLSTALGREVPLSLLFRASTVSALCSALDERVNQGRVPGSDPLAPVIQLNEGDGPALFCIHPADGLAWCYAGLSRYLSQPRIIGLQAPGLTAEDPPSFDAVVHHYLETVRALQPDGPYRLLGWSSGGGIAHAMAAQLRRAGRVVSLLAMLDSYPSDIWRGTPEPTREDALASMLDDLDASATAADGRRYDSEELFARLKRPGSSLAMFDDATLWRMCDVALASMRGYRQARHARFDGDLLFFRAARRSTSAADHRSWRRYITGRLECIDVDAGHLGMCQVSSLQQIARVLSPRL